MAGKAGHFSFADVAALISDKVVFRHPHVHDDASRALFFGVVGYATSSTCADGGERKKVGPFSAAGVALAMTKPLTYGFGYLSRDLSDMPTGGGITDANKTVDTPPACASVFRSDPACRNADHIPNLKQHRRPNGVRCCLR